jgi:hypothetical protein
MNVRIIEGWNFSQDAENSPILHPAGEPHRIIPWNLRATRPAALQLLTQRRRREATPERSMRWHAIGSI